MNWLATVNTTNLRIVSSIVLFALYIVGTMGLSAIGHAPSGEVLYTLGTALLISMGLDVAQFRVKRKTHIVQPPDVMADDAAAVATAPDVAPEPPAPHAASWPDGKLPPRPVGGPYIDPTPTQRFAVPELPAPEVTPPAEPDEPTGLTDDEMAAQLAPPAKKAPAKRGRREFR